MANQLFPYTETIYNVTGKTASENGAIYRIVPKRNQDLVNGAFRAFLVATQSGGASSPTTDLKVQTSVDGTNWIDWTSVTQLTADGTNEELEGANSQDLGVYVRAVLTLGGGTAPTVAAKVLIASNIKFTVESVT